MMRGVVTESGGKVETRKRRRKQASSCVDFVDDALTEEILVRLPVKSVMRFQLVCKSWLSLISTDRFHRLHTLRGHKSPPSLLLVRHDKETKYRFDEKVTLFYANPIIKRSDKLRRSKIPDIDTNLIKRLSCSNGLMLLQFVSGDYYVCNPTTKKSKKLSLVAHNHNFITVSSIHLVFDPASSPHYKVICIRPENELSPRQYQIEVFDSKSGMWRVCVEPFRWIRGIGYISDCIQSKSFIYLISRLACYTRFFYFDIDKNVSQIIACPLPKCVEEEGGGGGGRPYFQSLQESNGCLYYCALLSNYQRKQSAALFELQQPNAAGDDPRWLFKYRYRIHGLGFELLTFIPETATILLGERGKIVACNFPRKSFKEILDDPEFKVSYYFDIHKFGETLAPL